jgi:hypothetical protein
MLTFDTLKFRFPLSICKRVQKQCFTHYIRNSPVNGLEIDKLVSTNPKLGIKDICINQMNETVCIELSAKILESNYINNISAENFEAVLEKIKQTDLLYFNNSDFKNKMTFHRIDCSKNIILQEDTKKYIDSLSFIANAKNYNFQNYKSQSITFSKNPLSKRRRLRFIFYDKFTELKKDKNFCKVDNIDRYRNILRFEITLNNYFLIRKYLNLKKNEEINYFNTIENNTNIFQSVYSELYNSCSNHNGISLYDSNFKSLSELEKYFGRQRICGDFDFDFKKISSFIRNSVKGNVSKYYSTYKQVCNDRFKNELNLNQDNYLNKIYNYVA